MNKVLTSEKSVSDMSSITGSYCRDVGITSEEKPAEYSFNSIFGRERERLLLAEAYHIMLETRQRQTVILHGCSGVGKTALVEQLRNCICEANDGYFCSGKYFQNTGVQEPYSAIMAGFSDLCDLISQDDDLDEAWMSQIRAELGPDIHLLNKVISNLAPFVSSKSKNSFESVDYRMDSAVAKFKIACKSFLRAMSSGVKPVVVFLDDIQWMDEGSRQLIEMYLHDFDLKNVMFILAYRDEEEETVNKLLPLGAADKDKFLEIPLLDLGSTGVAEITSGILASPAETIADLVELVMRRTAGNPFHVVQFIDAVRQEELLTFDSQRDAWEYDVDEIQREIMVSDTLADLILRKIQILPHNEQEHLKIASLLGYSFDERLLLKVVNNVQREELAANTTTSSEVPLPFSKALEFGIIERTRDELIFSHDKVQSAFRSMLDDSKEKEIHRIIGETFLLQSESKEGVYQAAVHLNQVGCETDNLDIRRRLARINLEASRYCNERSAFDTAVSLLNQGLALLHDEEKWEDNFDLSFDMTEALAQMELTIGNLDSCKKLTHEVLSRAKSLDMKIKPMLIDVECHMAGHEMLACIRTASNALATLGVMLPQKVSGRHVMLRLLRVRRMLRRRNDEDILQMQNSQDRATSAKSKILIDLAFYCLMQDEPLLGVYSAMVAFELTLLHGLSPHSASAAIMYGLVELNFQSRERADRFGKLGMKLMEKLECKDTECMAISLWVSNLSHWKQPLQNSRAAIRKAVNSGFLCGDPVYTALAIANSFGLAYALGDNLPELEDYMQETYSQLCDLSQKGTILWAQPLFQTVLNLQREGSDFKDLTVLSGNVMQEADFFREVDVTNHTVLKVIAWTVKAQLCYLFGYAQRSEELYDRMTNLGKAFFNNTGAMAWYFYGSLTYYERYRKSGKHKHLRTARKWQRELLRIQARGSPNVSRVAILCAEDKSVQKSCRFDTVSSAYHSAILLMKEEKMVHMEALANERAGFFFNEHGCSADALQHWNCALDLYEEWGATAKADWVQEEISKASREFLPDCLGDERIGLVIIDDDETDH